MLFPLGFNLRQSADGGLVEGENANDTILWDPVLGKWKTGPGGGGPGPQGPQGNQGAAGATGPQGPQGAAGADGAQGAQGNQGAAGSAGPQGPQGAAGAGGAQGPQGNQGAAGAAGSQGPQGTAGSDGAQGPQGNQGAAGAAGSQGPQGAAGADGAQGPQGNQGAAGTQGPQGNQGPAGSGLGDGAIVSYTIEAQTAPGSGSAYAPLELDSPTFLSFTPSGWSLTAGDTGPWVNNTGASRQVLLTYRANNNISAADQVNLGYSVNGANPTRVLPFSGTNQPDFADIVTVPNGQTVWPAIRAVGGSTVACNNAGVLTMTVLS